MKVIAAANKKLVDLCKGYYQHLPLGEAFEIANLVGLPVQEDGEPWSGFLCGHEGRATIELQGVKQCLQLQWFRMESGRFEFNAYIA